jgi:tripartite-type tricarboxylate transporter receptor subunit TctC
MNKILFLLSLLISTATLADPVKVVIYWGWPNQQAQTPYYRTMLDQANLDQKKYEFVLEIRPGAGGGIAAKAATDDKDSPRRVVLLAHSNAFFVRPYLYPDLAGYSFDQFRPVMIQGHANLGLVVTSGKTMEQLLSQKELRIGTSGAGSFNHMLVERLTRTIFASKDTTVVHFTSQNDALIAVAGGHIDTVFAFRPDIQGNNRLSMAAIIGRKSYPGTPLLANYGVPALADASVNWFILAKRDLPIGTLQEIQQILLKAEQNPLTQKTYEFNQLVQEASYKNPATYDDWYRRQQSQIRYLSNGVVLK